MKEVKFVKSSTVLDECPKSEKAEYAFIGRSNVGKSSLINMLVERKKMAHTSGTPGKTRSINHFLIDEEWFLVDLPGYGYAKISRTERNIWKKNTWEYLLKREHLECVFLLIDLRIDPQKTDLNFLDELVNHEVPFALIFTKAEKMSSEKRMKSIEKFAERVKAKWNDMPDYFISSAKSKLGRESILAYINQLNSEFQNK